MSDRHDLPNLFTPAPFSDPDTSRDAAKAIVGSPLLGFGNKSGSPTTDAFGKPRPSGSTTLATSGTATSGAATTLTDSGKAWRTNNFTGLTLRITGGTGSGQTKLIASNTATAITVNGNWVTNP